MFFTISLEYIINNLVAIRIGKINVKVRGRSAVRIEEALKIKIQFDGINICYPQAKSNNRICTTSPSDIIKPAGLCIPYDIPVYQELGSESKLINNL